MPRVRGFDWAVYRDDVGRSWALFVDVDSIADPARGWLQPADAFAPLPRAWLPRRVVGVDPEGHRRAVRVGTDQCDLWTGFVTTWSMEATDGTLVPITRVSTEGERRRSPPNFE